MSLSAMLDSDPEMEDSTMHQAPTPDSSFENIAPVKASRAKPKANTTRTTKTKTTSQQQTTAPASRKAPVPKKSNPSKRAALQEQRNERKAIDSEEDERADEAAELDDSAPLEDHAAPSEDDLGGAMEARPSRPRSKPSQASRARPAQDLAKAAKRAVKAANPPRKIRVQEDARQRARPISLEADEPTPPPEDEAENEASPEPIRQATRPAAKPRARAPANSRKRTASFSDAERGLSTNDVATRRKLGEMTKRFENLELKYRNLREIGIKEAEANFNTLRRQTEDKTEAANKLIASLKKDREAQTTMVRESRGLRRQLDERDAELARLRAKVDGLTTALSESKAEQTALSAKLQANRAAATALPAIESRRPALGAKGNDQSRHGATATAEAVQTAQLKEDLYSDLTGLLLRSVKREADADVFDCIQTGKNGTLRFKLSVATNQDGSEKESKTGSGSGSGSGSSYENTEFVFTPIFDSTHDVHLMELLPDYLTEEITFTRANAGKFYARVVKTLTQA